MTEHILQHLEAEFAERLEDDEFSTVSPDSVADKPTHGVNAYGVPYTLEPMEQIQHGIRLARRARRRALQQRFLNYFHPMLLENPELAPAFCDDLCTGHALVDAIGALQIQGMIFDGNWIGCPLLQTTPGSTNFTVLLVWAWLVDRYRPIKDKPSVSSSQAGSEENARYFLKFPGTDYITTYARLARELGMTSRKAEEAIKFLERQGMIGRRPAPEARSEDKGNEKPFAVWPIAAMVRLATGRGNINSVLLSESTGNTVADELAQIKFFGHVIDYTWLDHPAFDDETNKGLMLIVFAELYYFHTPKEDEDKFSHFSRPRTKRFDGDVMYKSYRLWSQKTGLSTDQLRRALAALVKAGLIKKWRAPVYDRMGEPTNNKILIELIFDRVLEVTYGTCQAIPRHQWTKAQVKALEAASKQTLNIPGSPKIKATKLPTEIAHSIVDEVNSVQNSLQSAPRNCTDHAPVKTDHAPVKTDHAPVKTDHAPVKTDHAPVKTDHAPGNSHVHSKYTVRTKSLQNQQQQQSAQHKKFTQPDRDETTSSVVVVSSVQKSLPTSVLPGTACIGVTATPPLLVASGPSAELRDALNQAGLALAEIDSTFEIAVGHWGERAEAELWDQIEELPRRNPREPGAMLRTAIVKGFATPHAKAARRAREGAAAREKAAEDARREREASEATQRAREARQRAATAVLDAAFAGLPASERAAIDTKILAEKPILRGREDGAAMAVARRAALSDVFESLTDGEAQQQPESERPDFAAIDQILPAVRQPGAAPQMNRREIGRVVGMAQQRMANDPLADDIELARDTLGSQLDDDEWDIVVAQVRRAA